MYDVVYVYVYACMYVCMYVCDCMYIYIYIYKCDTFPVTILGPLGPTLYLAGG